MRRLRTISAVVLVAVLLAGCGVSASGVQDAGRAPARAAPGATVYFVDAHGRLRPQVRRSDHIATISEALSWLLAGPTRPGLRTQIGSVQPTQVLVTNRPGVIQLLVPMTVDDVTQTGIDQIVCTALAAYVQAGGSPRTRVQVVFTQQTPASDRRRTCSLIS
jgi:hypothetical protein